MTVFHMTVSVSEEMQYFEQFSWERVWNLKISHSQLVKQTFTTIVILEMKKPRQGDVIVSVWTSAPFAVPQVSGKTEAF